MNAAEIVAAEATGKDGNVRVAALVFHQDGEALGDSRKAWATACQAAGGPREPRPLG
jgi:hypothetical protein